MGREMYFISKGYVEVWVYIDLQHPEVLHSVYWQVLCEDLSQVVAVQGPGGFFGEVKWISLPEPQPVRVFCSFVYVRVCSWGSCSELQEHWQLEQPQTVKL